MRVYKNGRFYHKYEETGKFNDLWLDPTDNTLVTNRRNWNVGKKQHRFGLSNKTRATSAFGGILYNFSNAQEITLISN